MLTATTQERKKYLPSISLSIHCSQTHRISFSLEALEAVAQFHLESEVASRNGVRERKQVAPQSTLPSFHCSFLTRRAVEFVTPTSGLFNASDNQWDQHLGDSAVIFTSHLPCCSWVTQFSVIQAKAVISQLREGRIQGEDYHHWNLTMDKQLCSILVKTQALKGGIRCS